MTAVKTLRKPRRRAAAKALEGRHPWRLSSGTLASESAVKRATDVVWLDGSRDRSLRWGFRMLTAYGAAVVTLMMLFYALEGRSPWFTFAFGLACLGSATYGFLAHTWPFGVVETVWGALAFHKWLGRRSRRPASPSDRGG
jgi:hypothetical protein